MPAKANLNGCSLPRWPRPTSCCESGRGSFFPVWDEFELIPINKNLACPLRKTFEGELHKIDKSFSLQANAVSCENLGTLKSMKCILICFNTKIEEVHLSLQFVTRGRGRRASLAVALLLTVPCADPLVQGLVLAAHDLPGRTGAGRRLLR